MQIMPGNTCGCMLWATFKQATMPQARRLCKELRLILESRINMKKVIPWDIPYVALQFKKDKIWLRRAQPSKRTYQIVLAIDDSKSMHENLAGTMALETVTMLSTALTQLEVGKLAVASLGQNFQLLHPFTDHFSADSGTSMLQRFTFMQNGTSMRNAMRALVQTLQQARRDHHQTLIISDGRFGD